METREHPFRRNHTSFFFPIALITVGVVWLMVNNGMIPVENVYRLYPLWPLLLVVAGLSLILSRLFWPLGGLLWALTAAAIVFALLNPPAFLPDAAGAEVKRETFVEPIDGARSATVNLDLSVYSSQVSALSDSTSLISADLNYLGRINFRTSGSDPKTVRLGEDLGSALMRFNFFTSGQLSSWKIGLTPEIPLRLRVDGGTGSVTLDLQDLQLESLNVDGGTGSLRVQLPENSPRFPFVVNGGTGSVNITIPSGTGVDLNVDGGTGSLTINIPEDAGVQIDVRSGGLGSFNLPRDFTKVRGSENERKEGVWENSAYATAADPINIILDIGTGSVTIR